MFLHRQYSQLLSPTRRPERCATEYGALLHVRPSGLSTSSLVARSAEKKGGLPLVSTFHSLGVRLLREFHKEAGIPRGFSIWDRDDSIRAVKTELKRLDTEEWTPRQILSAISREKGAGKTLREYREHASTRREQTTALVWERYEHALADESSLDFDDLLVRTLALLRDSTKTRALLQNRWHYLIVDEYQDTSNVQYELIKLLSGERHNVCVVGDLDQCIYTWRQAEIENLLSFERAFPNVKTVRLEQNYRSTRTIVSAANAVIEKNTNRVPKTLFSGTKRGPSLCGALDERYEACTGTNCRSHRTRSPRQGIAVPPQNAQSRVLSVVTWNTIPRLSTRFFERKR